MRPAPKPVEGSERMRLEAHNTLAETNRLGLQIRVWPVQTRGVLPGEERRSHKGELGFGILEKS